MDDYFPYLYIEPGEDSLEVHCTFRAMNKEVEEESRRFLNLLFLVLEDDINLHLDKPAYINHKFFLSLLSLGRELKSNGRTLTLYNPPDSIRRFLEKYDVEEFIRLA
jgi:hypothetical protein